MNSKYILNPGDLLITKENTVITITHVDDIAIGVMWFNRNNNNTVQTEYDRETIENLYNSPAKPWIHIKAINNE
jgi:hypothetical protein